MKNSIPDYKNRELGFRARLALLIAAVFPIPFYFIGSLIGSGSLFPKGYIHFPPGNFLVPKEGPNDFFHLLFFIFVAIVFLGLVIFPYLFHPISPPPFKLKDEVDNASFKFFVSGFYSDRRSNHPNENKVIPIWGKIAFPCFVGAGLLMWAQPSQGFLHQIFLYCFPILWFSIVFGLDAYKYYSFGESLFGAHMGRAPFGLTFVTSSVGWLYFELVGYYTQNWYYSCPYCAWSREWYIFIAGLCYSTIFPALFEVVDILSTSSFFYRYTNGPRVLLRVFKWFLIFATILGVLVSAYNPLAGFGFICFWLAPTFLIGFTLTEVGWFNPWWHVEMKNYRPLVITGLSGLFVGVIWEFFNYISPTSPSYWRYDVPYFNKWHVFEMPLVGYAAYLAFGVCCWTMHYASVGISGLSYNENLAKKVKVVTWYTVAVWSVVAAILYVVVFFPWLIFPGITLRPRPICPQPYINCTSSH